MKTHMEELSSMYYLERSQSDKVTFYMVPTHYPRKGKSTAVKRSVVAKSCGKERKIRWDTGILGQ